MSFLLERFDAVEFRYCAEAVAERSKFNHKMAYANVKNGSKGDVRARLPLR